MRCWAGPHDTEDGSVHYLGCRTSRRRQAMNYKRCTRWPKGCSRTTEEGKAECYGEEGIQSPHACTSTHTHAHTPLGWLLLWARSMPTPPALGSPRAPSWASPVGILSLLRTVVSPALLYLPANPLIQSLMSLRSCSLGLSRLRQMHPREGQGLLREHSRTQPHKQLPNNKGVDA